MDGPLAVAARTGAICYLDEVVEAREDEDTVVVIHPLTDDRKVLPIDKAGEAIVAAPGFQLVASYNPGYQHALKDLKPSTRQRFVSLDFGFPEAAIEARIIAHESGVKQSVAASLVEVAHRVRRLKEQGLAEGPGTRLLVSAGRLIAEGIPKTRACHVAIAAALTDDPDLLSAIGDIIDTTMSLCADESHSRAGDQIVPQPGSSRHGSHGLVARGEHNTHCSARERPA